jgi:hypothetical protein
VRGRRHRLVALAWNRRPACGGLRPAITDPSGDSYLKLVPPDTCLKDYKKRRSVFLEELIASTPNVSVRAKEFRRWIDENSPHSDDDEA